MKEALKLFKALSDETRLKIILLLLDGERCVCEIIPHVKRKQATVSIQLAKLKKAGILKSRREGKKVIYRITNQKINKLLR